VNCPKVSARVFQERPQTIIEITPKSKLQASAPDQAGSEASPKTTYRFFSWRTARYALAGRYNLPMSSPAVTTRTSRRFSLQPAQFGALLAFLGVALGAFGAHAFSDILSPGQLETYQTAVRYQMFHALGLLALGALPPRAQRAAPWLFWGSVIFSGSLYALVFSGVSLLGAVAPIGGVLQLIGWALLFFGLHKKS